MATQGVLLDMKLYAERDGIDPDNFQEAFMISAYYEDQLVALPYVRSTPIYYYNKALLAEAGYEKAPETIEEFVEAGKRMTKVENGQTVVHGFELLLDSAWYLQNMLYQLGSNMLSDDGRTVPAFEDGTMLKVMSAWREWVDDGWCSPPAVTGSATITYDRFLQGKVAGIFASTGRLATLMQNAEETGIDLGVAFLPTWGKPAAPTGGGNIGILQRNKTDNQLAASWEFIRFLMSDEQVAMNSIRTGYLPVTKSSAQTALLTDFWAENPAYKTAFDQLANVQDLPFSPNKTEFARAWDVICSDVVIGRDITPEEGVRRLKEEANIILDW